MVIEYKELVTGIKERKGEFMIKTIESYGRLVMYVINKIFADLHDKSMADECYDDVFITV